MTRIKKEYWLICKPQIQKSRFVEKKMSQTGSTYGNAGSPGYNLSAAQFQQRVSDAERQCKKCNKGPGGTRYCKALIAARYYRCPADGKCELREDSCKIAAAAALAGCPTPSCSTTGTCGRCPCKECKSKSSCSKSRSSSCSKCSHSSSTKTPVPVPA